MREPTNPRTRFFLRLWKNVERAKCKTGLPWKYRVIIHNPAEHPYVTILFSCTPGPVWTGLRYTRLLTWTEIDNISSPEMLADFVWNMVSSAILEKALRDTRMGIKSAA